MKYENEIFVLQELSEREETFCGRFDFCLAEVSTLRMEYLGLHKLREVHQRALIVTQYENEFAPSLHRIRCSQLNDVKVKSRAGREYLYTKTWFLSLPPPTLTQLARKS